jgi:hypothetical protein
MLNERTPRTLTIYLAKENRKPNSLIKSRDEITERNLALGGGVTGRLLIKPKLGFRRHMTRHFLLNNQYKECW